MANPNYGDWCAAGSGGAVAAGGQPAVDAGIRLLNQGGNAIDPAARHATAFG